MECFTQVGKANDVRKKIRLVIVGAGVIGSHHGKVVNELSNEIELTGVVDVDLAKAQALASSRGSAAFVSLKDALAQAEFEAVAVCTPTGTHAEVAIEALNAGKHVIIEKPAEVSLEKTDAIIEAQRNAGTVVTVITRGGTRKARECVCLHRTPRPREH